MWPGSLGYDIKNLKIIQSFEQIALDQMNKWIKLKNKNKLYYLESQS